MSLRTTVEAYAKLNLYLDIVGKRPDGYHDLASVMQLIDLHDTVTITAENSGGITVKCDNPAVPADERNIAHKAARAFLAASGVTAGIDIAIQKRVPLDSGLGGSSTDGAAVLNGLNKLFGYPLSRKQLLGIGARLGADVPFCMTGGTAFCEGIGDRITPLRGVDASFLIIRPEVGFSTATAYALYDGSPVKGNSDINGFLQAVEAGNTRAVAGGMYNVFQQLYGDERIDAICRYLKENGALGSIMTGSGSAVFGLFADEITALNAAEIIDAQVKINAKVVKRLEIG